MMVVGLTPDPAMAPAMRDANVPLALPSTASNKRAGLELFALEPLTFRLGERQPAQRKAQHWRHRQRRDHRHTDNERVEILAEDAGRKSDRSDDHLGGTARIHGAGERERFPLVQSTELAAEEGAGELAEAGDED